MNTDSKEIYSIAFMFIYSITANAIGEPRQHLTDAPFFRALGEIESLNKDEAIGLKGEVSRFQIMPAMWKRYSDKPISKAKDPELATKIVVQICRDNSELFFHYARRYPTIKELYVMYNLGFTKYHKKNLAWDLLPLDTRERATAFEYLYLEYLQYELNRIRNTTNNASAGFARSNAVKSNATATTNGGPTRSARHR